MRLGLIICTALLICSCNQGRKIIHDEPKDEKWIEIQARCLEYKELAGPELVLIGRISIWGGRPAGKPEEDQQWFACIQIGNHPWVQVDDLSDYQEPFDSLRGERTLQDLNQVAVLIKAKLKDERSEGKSPVVIVGWMRELLPSDSDWSMPWQINVPLLPFANKEPIVSHVVSCQAIADANLYFGYSGVHFASQEFKILTSFYGNMEIGKNISLNYLYLAEYGRDLKKNERVIWILTKTNNEDLRGYGALPDTPNNRLIALELTNRLKESYQGKAQQ